jgi:uncharacterized RDD family membrane protein YckC
MAHELVVISPEKAVLTFRLAGFGGRALAHMLDLMILVAFLLLLSLGVGLVFGLIGGPSDLGMGLAGFIIALLFSIGPFLYFILFEWLWNGQTPGKKAMGLRVRSADGTPITFAGAVGRNLLRVADLMPGSYFVGVIAMFTTPKSQRIGDLFANTIVLLERMPVPVFRPAPHVQSTHALEERVGDLRGMTQEEYWALRRLCDRFPELPKSVQGRLLRDVWQPIAYRLRVPELPNVHPLYLAEAVVMRYGRTHGLL